MPDPRGNIPPTYEECEGFEWVHTPSFYATIRDMLCDDSNGFPLALVPLRPCSIRGKMSHLEFKRRLLTNLRRRQGRTAYEAEKPPVTPKKLRLY